jgi:hypothetical protein
MPHLLNALKTLDQKLDRLGTRARNRNYVSTSEAPSKSIQRLKHSFAEFGCPELSYTDEEGNYITWPWDATGRNELLSEWAHINGIEAPIIWDVFAGIGGDAVQFLHLFPDAEITAVQRATADGRTDRLKHNLNGKCTVRECTAEVFLRGCTTHCDLLYLDPPWGDEKGLFTAPIFVANLRRDVLNALVTHCELVCLKTCFAWEALQLEFDLCETIRVQEKNYYFHFFVLEDPNDVKTFSCLEHIWTKLETVLNKFNVTITTGPVYYSHHLAKAFTRNDIDDTTSHRFARVKICLNAPLFKAQLNLESETSRVFDDFDPYWIKTITYALCKAKRMNLRCPPVQQFRRSKPIARGSHSDNINLDKGGQLRIANFVVYDILNSIADILKINKSIMNETQVKEAVQPFLQNADVTDKIITKFRELMANELDRELASLLEEMKPDRTEEEIRNPETLREYSILIENDDTPLSRSTRQVVDMQPL